MKPVIYADFTNATPGGRIRLNTAGTREDLNRLGVALQAGLPVTLYTDDGDDDRGLTIEGVVERDRDESGWVANVDWSKIERQRSIPDLSDAVPGTASGISASFAG